MDHWQSVLPVPIHEVDYEETVADLEGVARRLIAACGLEWEPACLEFHRNQRPVRTASVTQVRQPIYRRSVGRWRNYETALADLFAKLPIDEEPPPSRRGLCPAGPRSGHGDGLIGAENPCLLGNRVRSQRPCGRVRNRETFGRAMGRVRRPAPSAVAPDRAIV